MPTEHFSFKHLSEYLSEYRDRVGKVYAAQPLRFRLPGMQRDLTESEKIHLAAFEAVVLTLRAINPDLVNVEALKEVMQDPEVGVLTFSSCWDG